MSVDTLSQTSNVRQPFSLTSEANADLPFNLFSTSPTTDILRGVYSSDLLSDIEFELEQSQALQAAAECVNRAPLICYPDGEGRWRLMQGCCNDWLCPRCGQMRAREEFARIVAGAKALADAGHRLYFITLTCRGRDCSLADAMEHYLEWTDRLQQACQKQAKRAGNFWAYVQVTERQQRQHPHSHLITTFLPSDAIATHVDRVRANGETYSAEVFVSLWFDQQNRRAGLGTQHRIEPVHNPIGLAAYVAKYLFKDCMSTVWPPRWKRIRYSRSWPKLPEISSPEAFPVVRAADWKRVNALPGAVSAADEYCYHRALLALALNVIYVGENER